MSLLRNYTLILLLSKSNTNLTFRATTAIAWSCMKLRLFHNPELLWYKVIKSCRRVQQRYSSWNLLVYIFTLSAFKICTFPSGIKNRRKIVKLRMYSHYILHDTRPPPHPTPSCTHLYAFELTPSPLTASFLKKRVKQLNPQICSNNIMGHGFAYLSIVFTLQLYFNFPWYHTCTTCLLKNTVYLAYEN